MRDAVADDSLYRPGNRKYLPRLAAHHLLHHLFVSLTMGMLLTSRVTGIVLIFVEVPLLMRICPTSEKFDSLVRRFNENWPRAGMYVGYAHPCSFDPVLCLFYDNLVPLQTCAVLGWGLVNGVLIIGYLPSNSAVSSSVRQV